MSLVLFRAIFFCISRLSHWHKIELEYTCLSLTTTAVFVFIVTRLSWAGLVGRQLTLRVYYVHVLGQEK